MPPPASMIRETCNRPTCAHRGRQTQRSDRMRRMIPCPLHNLLRIGGTSEPPNPLSAKNVFSTIQRIACNQRAIRCITQPPPQNTHGIKGSASACPQTTLASLLLPHDEHPAAHAMRPAGIYAVQGHCCTTLTNGDVTHNIKRWR